MSTVHRKNHIKIMFWNSQGIKSKIAELIKFLKNNDVDVVCLCETFLKQNHTFHIDGYICIRSDRAIGRLGGLAILIKSTIQASEVLMPNTSLIECMGLEINNGNRSLTIIAAYLPGGANDQLIRGNYSNDLNLLCSGRTDPFIIAGDLNSKSLQWNNTRNNLAGNILENFVNNSQMEVYFPLEHTYCPMSLYKSPATIDILLSNSLIAIDSIHCKKIFTSDHLPVFCRAEIEVDCVSVKRYNFAKANWTLFRRTIEAGLDSVDNQITSEEEIDEALAQLETIILQAKEEAIPQERNGSDGLFIDDETRFYVRQRNYFRMIYLRTRDPSDLDNYNYLRKLVKENIIRLTTERWETKLKDCDSNHTAVFKLAKSLKRKRIQIPPLGTAVSDSDKAEILSENFASNHNNPLKTKLIKHTRNVNRVVKTFLNNTNSDEPPPQIPYLEVAKTIKDLKNGKAAGEDQLCARVLKNLPNRAIFLITIIFNACLILNYFPLKWRHARVFPLLKPGKLPNVATSYRPISLLSILGKVFEKIVHKRLKKFLEEANCIPPEQFGFRNLHSTGLQILRIIKDVRQNFRNRLSTGFIAFDVEKAFDRVWHQGLLYKLIDLKMPTYLIKLIASFLKDRTFSIAVGKASSDRKPLNFGVPQGSVLSPTLYNTYIHDFPIIDACKIAQFADDTGKYTTARLYKTIKKRLEKGSRTLAKYLTRWKISLNSAKTEALFFTKRIKKQKPRRRDKVKIVGERISWGSSLKYLGCVLDTRLSLKLHIDERLKKTAAAVRLLYPLLNKRSPLSKKIKNRMFKIYIRPVMIYPAIVLKKASKTQLGRLQVRQNKILKFLNDLPPGFRTADLHAELKIQKVAEHIDDLYDRAEAKAEEIPFLRDIFAQD